MKPLQPKLFASGRKAPMGHVVASSYGVLQNFLTVYKSENALCGSAADGFAGFGGCAPLAARSGS
jgi:hypothetical protein